MKYKYSILLILFIISLMASIVLSVFPASQVCTVNLGCNTVQDSEYNYTFGIKNSFFGVVIFALVSWLIFLQINNPIKERRTLIHLSVIIGSIIAIYFLYIQHFVLKAYCEYCLLVDFNMLLALAIIILYWKK